eukprot:TRINITY_DN6040_c0_g1_i1.p1 TRINITY_DN6040_c0_g1~~TRINITY_DN6040_c0_g1_i1.p1  ORF type:complete len:243 (-),score=45.55 TRINITY_DN6040_c0_g1_i1:124-852(-)
MRMEFVFDMFVRAQNSSHPSRGNSHLPELYNLNGDLEKASLQVISSLVQSKDFFASTGATIDQVSSHLINLTEEGLDLDTRLSIVAVEKSTIAEHFEKLAQVMSDSNTSSWVAANTAIQSFTAALGKLSEVLDQVTDDNAPSGLTSTQNLLSNCTVTMLRGQWNPMHAAIRELTHTKVPAVLQQLAAAQHPLGQPHELQGMQRAVQMLQMQAEARIQHTESLMQILLPELEVAAVRVHSMFC